MNKSILLSLALAICSPAYATGLPSTLLPLPVEINTAEGVFQLPDTMAVSFDCRLSNDERNRLTRAIGRDLGAVTDATVQQSDISISLQEGKAESYVLSITPAGIHITGADPAGIFYGLQTLASLADGSRRINCITVRDYPQLPYRGMMIDISRHFHGKEFLLKQIEAMALLKLNNLHLHLTDAAGWRVAIDRYPLLTGYAAWRPQYRWQDWEADGCRYVQEGSPDAYGGYLTKSDVAEML